MSKDLMEEHVDEFLKRLREELLQPHVNEITTNWNDELTHLPLGGAIRTGRKTITIKINGGARR